MSLMKWPHRPHRSVPSRSEAEDLAMEVRRIWRAGAPDAPLRDLSGICRAGRFRVIERTLSAAAGGGEALLSPEPHNRFEIWVDPEPRGGWDRVPASRRPALRRHRIRFRVAHEIAHSFFYDRGSEAPVRLVPDSDAQEQFADNFARALLLPRVAIGDQPLMPKDVVRLQRRYDVSLEVAVRAVASAQPRRRWGLLFCSFDQGPSRLHEQWSSGPLPCALAALAPYAQPGAHNASPELADGLCVAYLPGRAQLVWTAPLGA
jgi:hypothetical protein